MMENGNALIDALVPHVLESHSESHVVMCQFLTCLLNPLLGQKTFPVPCFRCLSGPPRPPGESKEAQLKSNIVVFSMYECIHVASGMPILIAVIYACLECQHECSCSVDFTDV